MAMVRIKSKFDVSIGYSDHTLGIEVPIAATALGARVIEKHFTLNRNLVGPDHKASLEPNELKTMVSSIRNTEKMLGDGIKKVEKSEEENLNIARKSIVAKRAIKKGDLFTVNNLITKRPGSGISPMNWYDIIGMKSLYDFDVDDLIRVD